MGVEAVTTTETVETQTEQAVEETTVTEEATVESKTEETQEVDVTAEFKAEIKELKKLTETQSEQLSAFESTKTELEKQTTLVGEYEAILTELMDAKLADVSDEIKALMPNGSIKEKFDWINKAEAANLFKKPETNKSTKSVEIGKPIDVASTDKKVDTSKLTATQLMQMAYSSLKK